MNEKKDYKKIKEILVKYLGEYYAYKPLQILFYCPYCNHHYQKLSVNLEHGWFKCWVCKKSGKKLSLLRNISNTDKQIINNEYNHVSSSESEDLFEQEENEYVNYQHHLEHIKKEWSKYNFLPLLKSEDLFFKKQVLLYLSIRNLDYGDLVKYNIHFDYNTKNITFPSYDKQGNMNFFINKNINERYSKPKTSQEYVIFNDIYIDWEEDLYITEGIFDEIKINNNTVSLLTSELNENTWLFSNLIKHQQRKILCLDKDAYLKSIQIAKKLLKYGIKDIFIIDWRNCNKYKDFGEFKNKQEANEFLQNNIKQIDYNYIFRNEMTL